MYSDSFKVKSLSLKRFFLNRIIILIETLRKLRVFILNLTFQI
ncbi:hypothetical protein HMPREF9094_0709 [Fusobacterium animalis ATCC 51191]|uniref:Uncharacterized protein n=1 Tax=Fusobacterium animalis ATCC 51191 TaxID=997347 RepID=F9ELA4_9FUSO|nr:hypothetical protein HMPREF9094_0709 [Fusobacterium animalis ATCC 51191]